MLGRKSHMMGRVRDWLDPEGRQRRRLAHAFRSPCTHWARLLRDSLPTHTRVAPRLPARAEGFFVGRNDRHRKGIMSEQGAAAPVTGAQSLIRSLECAGAENVFG